MKNLTLGERLMLNSIYGTKGDNRKEKFKRFLNSRYGKGSAKHD